VPNERKISVPKANKKMEDMETHKNVSPMDSNEKNKG
jgi:hypothetical protein